MNADIRGALAQIDRSYKAFTHKGRCMTRDEVKKVLEYGLSKGYNHTGEFSDTEVDEILSAQPERKEENNAN